MSTINLLVFATASGLLLLLALSVAWAFGGARRESAARAQLTLLRVLVWASAVVAGAYVGAEAVLFVQDDFHGFTWAACLPMVIFGTAAVAAIWHLRHLKRQTLARHQTTR